MSFAALAFLTLATGTLTQPAPQVDSHRLRIIDMHLHGFRLDDGEAPPPNPVTRKPSAATTTAEIREASLAALKRYNIVKAITSGTLASVAAWREAAPDTVIPGVYVETQEPLPDLAKLRVYLMHAGGPFLEETKAIMGMYRQVYADLGAIDWVIPREEFHAALQSLMRAGLGKRLMFGSDQMIWPEAIGMAIEGVESAAFLTEEQKRDIFYNNAARSLRIDEAKEFRGAVSKSTPPNRRIQPPSRAQYRCAERVRLHAARG